LQIAYRARDITEAHIVAGLIEANGIETYVGGLYLQGAMGEIGDEDLYRARQVVSEYEASAPEAVVTGDDDRRPDFYARGFLLALAILGLVLLAL
ncbi:unnamed protein product, partial [Ectocarpus sp. 12 AP-2014]